MGAAWMQDSEYLCDSLVLQMTPEKRVVGFHSFSVNRRVASSHLAGGRQLLSSHPLEESVASANLAVKGRSASSENYSLPLDPKLQQEYKEYLQKRVAELQRQRSEKQK